MIKWVGYQLCKMHQWHKKHSAFIVFKKSLDFDEIPSGNLFPLVNVFMMKTTG